MGNSNNSNQPLQKGEGYRIIAIKENSPFEGKIDLFFDFIIEVIAPEAERSPSEILDKLSGPPKRTAVKSPLQILNENIDKNITIKLVSTKYRKIRTIEVTPNNKWGNNKDLIGITVRKQRFDQAFETYYPLIDIKANSPIKKAGVKEGQYLIGCLEYPYQSLDIFMEGLYEKFFDKQSKDKNVHLAIYDIASDTLYMKEVTLNRGWGGKGLLGCEFLQGMLNKFPTNLEEQRKEIIKREAKKSEILKLRNELGECDGASRLLAQSLQNQKNKKQTHFKNLKNLLNIEPPKLTFAGNRVEKKEIKEASNPSVIEDKDARIDQLEQRVSFLQTSFSSLKQYFEQMRESSQIVGQEQ